MNLVRVRKIVFTASNFEQSDDDSSTEKVHFKTENDLKLCFDMQGKTCKLIKYFRAAIFENCLFLLWRKYDG